MRSHILNLSPFTLLAAGLVLVSANLPGQTAFQPAPTAALPPGTTAASTPAAEPVEVEAPVPVGGIATYPGGLSGGSGYGGGGIGANVVLGQQALTADPFGQVSRPALPTVVSFGALDQTNVEQMNEDLRIMSFLVEKAVQRKLGNAPTYRMGIPMLYRGGSRSVRSLYLDGYGVVFFVRVNFPLIGAAATPKTPDKPAKSTEWEEARNQLRGNQPENTGEWGGQPIQGNPHVPQYNADLVEEFKTEMIRTLKGAANVRGLSGDNYVVISIEGSAAPETMRADPTARNLMAPELARRYGLTMTQRGPSDGELGTFVTLRVRKSDVDAFESGQLKFEEFRKKVSISSRLGTKPVENDAETVSSVLELQAK